MIKLKNITKTFPGVKALNDVDFEVNPGEIHVLFGENGAGKSTLVNIIVGNLAPDSGTYQINGQKIDCLSPKVARLLGISAVSQEFSLAPSLSVLDNLFLGREPTRWGITNKKVMVQRAYKVLNDMKVKLPLFAPVNSLSRAQKQQAEIAKALMLDAKVLILDEPTASLTDIEAKRVIQLVKDLRQKCVAIIYISHRMREIRALANRVTVLRNGESVGTIESEEITENTLVEMMTGKKAGSLFPDISIRPGSLRLKISDMNFSNGGGYNISLSVHSGEIVGIAGLVGCGKGRIGRAVFGLEPIKSGKIEINGETVTQFSPRRIMRLGACYFPSDRVSEGLCMNRPVRENITMATLDSAAFVERGFIRLNNESNSSMVCAEHLKVDLSKLETSVENLSGGNRQKVLLARGFIRDIELFIFDEPTVGVDINAKSEIYLLMKSLVEHGAGILLISSDLEEIIKLSNRIYTMHNGSIVAELMDNNKSEENILSCFFGK
ncbi:sugar ABC transporter ATP-binding protein [Desulfosarcina ovata]|uniref:Sugar ABC transporter ATP-binding protein n=1 Tax=Desulfosarcina ovata subsp. ovata TaxID=2752305 RepID=A0A5K8A469_9BACT|nr:sugar ABC transporter ATP-binding protein [Desulfosarcina ovata]BBO87208.1 sugar ABC transporter ATP-binding protein [Desulfosarcina ovata subsp. ovata]